MGGIVASGSRGPVDPLTEGMEVVGAGLCSDVLECPDRDRVGLRHGHGPYLVGVGVLVAERRVASFPADGDEPVLVSAFRTSR